MPEKNMDKGADDLRSAANQPKERVAIALQLEVFGCDLEGRDFVENARTKIVSRGGATIVINRPLAAEQTLTIKRAGSRQEAEVRVVGHLGKSRGAEIYGIVFLEEAANFWVSIFLPKRPRSYLINRLQAICSFLRSFRFVRHMTRTGEWQ
jgi:hypothetical protein